MTFANFLLFVFVAKYLIFLYSQKENEYTFSQGGRDEKNNKMSILFACVRWCVRFFYPEELHALAELEVGVNSSRCPTCTNMYMLVCRFGKLKQMAETRSRGRVAQAPSHFYFDQKTFSVKMSYMKQSKLFTKTRKEEPGGRSVSRMRNFSFGEVLSIKKWLEFTAICLLGLAGS